MKTALGTCIISLVVVLAAPFAHADERDDSRLRRDIRGEQQQDRAAAQNRPMSVQESAAQGDQLRRPGERMSPDERRALRRQIDEANNNITSKKR